MHPGSSSDTTLQDLKYIICTEKFGVRYVSAKSSLLHVHIHTFAVVK